MQSLYLQRIMKKNAAKGYEKTKPKQTQSKPILEGMNVNFCAAGYYHRVVLIPLNEHIDIIYKRFSLSDFVIIFNL